MSFTCCRRRVSADNDGPGYCQHFSRAKRCDCFSSLAIKKSFVTDKMNSHKNNSSAAVPPNMMKFNRPNACGTCNLWEHGYIMELSGTVECTKLCADESLVFVGTTHLIEEVTHGRIWQSCLTFCFIFQMRHAGIPKPSVCTPNLK